MTQPLSRINGTAGARRHFRYFDYMLAAFVSILLLSNLIGAAKLANVGGHIFGAGILFFPISYILGDVLTEVYGYANARRCVWVGFFAQLFMAFMSYVVVAMPPAADWGCSASGAPMFADVVKNHSAGIICQSTYESVFGSTTRIVAASVTAFWVGEFVNSFVLAKMKIWTAGKHLWTRTWGSTIAGQAVDSLIFYPLAFAGVWTTPAPNFRPLPRRLRFSSGSAGVYHPETRDRLPATARPRRASGLAHPQVFRSPLLKSRAPPWP